MTLASELVVAARSLIGTPYRHQGRSDAACDCIGFLFAAMRRAGVELEQELSGDLMQWNYGRKPDGRALTLSKKWCSPVKERETGLLVLFQYTHAPHPQHFAILGDDGKTMIHAHQPMKKVVEHGLRPPWTKWVHSMYRIPSVRYPGSTL